MLTILLICDQFAKRCGAATECFRETSLDITFGITRLHGSRRTTEFTTELDEEYLFNNICGRF